MRLSQHSSTKNYLKRNESQNNYKEQSDTADNFVIKRIKVLSNEIEEKHKLLDNKFNTTFNNRNIN